MHSEIYNLYREKHYFKLAQLLAAGIRTLILFLIVAGIRTVIGHSVGSVRWVPLLYFGLELLVIFADEIEHVSRHAIQFYIHLFQRMFLPFETYEKRHERKHKELEELEEREKRKPEEAKKKDK